MYWILRITFALTFAVCHYDSSASASFARNISVAVNPNCTVAQCLNASATDAVNVIHLKATGPRDAVHVLWSTVGAPSALVARTGLDDDVVIDWAGFVNGEAGQPAVHFSKDPSYAFGFLLPTLVEYDDVEDRADPQWYSDNNKTLAEYVHKLDQQKWKPVQVQNDSFVFESSSASGLGESMVFKVSFRGVLSRGAELPRLQYTPNNTYCDLILQNTTTRFKHSRFFFQLVAVNSKSPLTLTTEATIDDEYTPGVFKTFNFGAQTDGDANTDDCYVQWKPLVYTSVNRNLESETSVQAKDPVDVDEGINEVKSVVGSYFGKQVSQGLSKQMNVCLGQSEDKFYAHSSYSVWTFTVGLGKAPQDSISALVIVVISCGLGIPAIVILFGGIFAGCRKKKADRPPGETVAAPDVTAPLLGESSASNYGGTSVNA